MYKGAHSYKYKSKLPLVSPSFDLPLFSHSSSSKTNLSGAPHTNTSSFVFVDFVVFVVIVVVVVVFVVIVVVFAAVVVAFFQVFSHLLGSPPFLTSPQAVLKCLMP